MSKPRIEIVPAILAADINEYNQMLGQTVKFAERVSLDFTDGEFAPTTTINLIQAHWPSELIVDFHLMYKNPLSQLETIVSLKPSLTVIHAEAEGDKAKMIAELKQFGIRAGLALLQPTNVANEADLIKNVDHVLIFSGDLGKYGGQFDSSQLTKVKEIRAINPNVEISWDGGANESNVAEIAAAGVDVINSGGFIQKAEDPQKAYDRLVQIANSAANKEKS